MMHAMHRWPQGPPPLQRDAANRPRQSASWPSRWGTRRRGTSRKPCACHTHACAHVGGALAGCMACVHVQAKLYPRVLAAMKPGATLGLSHGFLLGVMRNDGVDFRKDINVVLVAPKVCTRGQ